MATKSSKIAVTLQPSLKQKLREYGKENQIKNFSGVILSILDEYFGDGAPAAAPSTSSSDVWETIQALTARIDALENGSATTSKKIEKPKTVAKAAKAKPTSTRRTGRSSARTKSTATKSTTKRSTAKSTGKTASTTKTAKTAAAKKAKPVKATKSTSTKAKSTRSVKSSSKAAPAKKTKSTTRRAATGRKTKAKATADWMSTREAFNIYGGNLSWSRFSKLTPEELKERFNLDSDLNRKVRGSRFNQWLKPGK